MFYLVRKNLKPQTKQTILESLIMLLQNYQKLVPRNGVVQLFAVEIRPKISTFWKFSVYLNSFCGFLPHHLSLEINTNDYQNQENAHGSNPSGSFCVISTSWRLRVIQVLELGRWDFNNLSCNYMIGVFLSECKH